MVASVVVPRLADAVMRDMLSDHSAILVTGPRATGKTTMARAVARSTIDLADANTAAALRADPVVGLADRAAPVLVDEWQVVPETLAAIKTLVDRDPQRGHFLVTGSVRGAIDSPTWPGTGRLVHLRMYGLVEREIEARLDSGPSWLAGVLEGDVRHVSSSHDLRDYVERALRSGFPEPVLGMSPAGRARWLTSYVEQLVTRDVEDLGAQRDPDRLRRYLQAVALNSAGIVDDVTLYQAAGVAKATGRAYGRLLENLLVLESVPAWTTNRLKRMALAPKRYLVDAGLFAGVLGVDARAVLRDGDLLGRVVDTFVTAQIRTELALMSPQPRLHHLRTAEGRHEIDLLIEVGARELVAIEIKATANPGRDDARHLVWLRGQFGEAVRAAVVLHTGRETVEIAEGVIAVPIAALWS